MKSITFQRAHQYEVINTRGFMGLREDGPFVYIHVAQYIFCDIQYIAKVEYGPHSIYMYGMRPVNPRP